MSFADFASAIPVIGPIVSAGLGYASGAKDRASREKMNQQNIDFQREANAQNEMLTRESWARDDNAVQRRTDDLRAAGLSATLAAGSPAGVSQPIRMQPPQVESEESGQAIMAALQGLQMQADYSMTRAQTNLINAQKQKALDENDREGDYHDLEMQERRTRIGQISNRTSMDQYDFNLAKQWNVPTHSSGVVSQVLPIIDAIQGAFKEGTITYDLVQKAKNELIPNVVESVTQGRGVIGVIDSFLNTGTNKFSPLAQIIRRFLPK
jgi:hypothetical protein